jgi:hypothetical protein
MFWNTFEHGYSDAVHGKQRALGSKDYREGFDRGVRYMKSQKALELAMIGIVGVAVAIAAFIWITAKVSLV